MKIKELLIEGNNILKEARVDDYIIKSRILLSNLICKNKEYLIVHDNESVDIEIENAFFKGIKKMKNGIPIQYIINKQEFMGLNFYVNENVLIPQPDTEILVEEILKKVEKNNKILDLCTGSGAIGISIAYYSKEKNLQITLSDISSKAIDVAKKNLKTYNLNCKIIKSDLFENINEKFDIIVSNPPYIESKTIDSLDIEVKNEPIIALDGGIDGLDFYRRISKKAKLFLNTAGILALEIGYNQKNSVIDILKKDGYLDIYSKKDYAGNDRIIICRRGE